ncbi:hypothetical protein BP6252_02984 [Coleophoma cylindrospora]|uniref:Uncharacterized protein n=1 Tax=Coleophoma cylindrospora TaxID=1849047 RepID=A0A3D8S6F9_9HELO|nr:hypothetical protein BP6252_02984 [Coleophoma cylindrospora]
MAEVLAVVASGMSVVSLAVQFADSFQKLKDFYDRISEAPEEIRLALEQVEILSLILEDIDRDLQQSVSSSSAIKVAAMKSLRICAMANQDLLSLVQKLGEGMAEGKKRTSLKAAFKKDNIELFRMRLENAKSTMLLAHQCYYSLIQRQNWDSYEQDMAGIQALVSKVVSLTSPSEFCPESSRRKIPKEPHIGPQSSITQKGVNDETKESPISPTSGSSKITQLRKFKYARSFSKRFLEVSVSKESTSTTITLRLPIWLWARRYDITLKRSHNGWDQSFRTYRLVPNDALVLKYSKNGNVAGLQDLFKANLASPFEADAFGLTPLHYAAVYAQAETCRFLIECGADANMRTYGGYFHLGILHYPHGPSSLEDQVINKIKCGTPLHLMAYFASCVSNSRARLLMPNSEAVTSNENLENEIQTTAEILYAKGQSDPFDKEGGGNNVFHLWTGPSQTFKWLQRQEESQTMAISVMDICHLIWASISSQTRDNAILNIRQVVPEGRIIRKLTEACSESPFLVWWGLMVYYVAEAFTFSPTLSPSTRERWSNLLEEVAVAGVAVNFHTKRLDGYLAQHTIFSGIIQIFWVHSPFSNGRRQSLRNLHTLFREWLYHLARAEINLLEYGYQELELHAKDETLWQFRFDLGRGSYLDYGSIQMLDLRIGEKPEDWRVEFEDLYVSSCLSRDFWILVEGTERQVSKLANSKFEIMGDDFFDDLSNYEDEIKIPGGWCD